MLGKCTEFVHIQQNKSKVKYKKMEKLQTGNKKPTIPPSD